MASITVPEQFYWGPFMRQVQRAKGRTDAAAAGEFARDALVAWCEGRRRGSVEAARRQEVRRLVPTPAPGQRHMRIAASLRGVLKEESFSRAVGARFGASVQGKRDALREALLEHLLRVRGQAEPQAAGAEEE